MQKGTLKHIFTNSFKYFRWSKSLFFFKKKSSIVRFGRISRQIKPKTGADGETNLCASKRWIRKSMCHNDSVHLCIQSTGETENEHTSTLHSHFMRGNSSIHKNTCLTFYLLRKILHYNALVQAGCSFHAKDNKVALKI